MFGVQVLVNLSVALAILPTKGLTLPFVSFGGSSLLVNAAAAGVLLNISRQGDVRRGVPFGEGEQLPLDFDGDEPAPAETLPSDLGLSEAS
jgi:cell division protein FtsW